ncbi:MAG: NfeD family protein [Candidatus Helarchaeota archaeon]
MPNWKLWKFIFFTALLEIFIAIIVAILLLIYFPSYSLYIVLGVIGFLAVYMALSYVIYKPVVMHQRVEPEDEVLGQSGMVIKALTPRGQVKVRNRTWSARSTGGFLEVGTKIKVIQMSGLQLKVEPIYDPIIDE